MLAAFIIKKEIKMAIEGTLDDYLNRRRRDPIPVIDEALNATVAQLYTSLKAYDSSIKDKPKDLNEIKKDRLRAKRKPLLQAFDTYKTNVFYGIVQETTYDKLKIIAWYEDIKALDEEAINNPPDAIKYYL